MKELKVPRIGFPPATALHTDVESALAGGQGFRMKPGHCACGCRMFMDYPIR